MKDKTRTILSWLPLAFGIAFGVLALSLHHIACENIIPSVYIQVPLYALVPAVFPLLEKFAKIKVPVFLVIVMTVQIIISVDFGTALNFYAFIPHYDKFLHTYFGLWCAPLVWYFIALFGGGGMKWWGKCIIVALSVLGVAALWEIFEFTMSLIISDYDPQLWMAAVASGGNPLWDTMMDIIVAFIGTCIFFVTLFIDYKTSGRLYRGTLSPEISPPSE